MKKILCATLLTLGLSFGVMAADMENVSDKAVSKMPQTAQKLLDMVADEAKISSFSAQLAKIEMQLNNDEASYSKTVDYIKALNATQDFALAERDVLETELANIQTQIAALGEMAGDGTNEPADIAKKRADFNKQADEKKSKIAEAELVIAKVDMLNGKILNLRNKNLVNSLTTREQSIIHPKTFYTSLVGFFAFLFDVLKSPVSWYNGLSMEQRMDVLRRTTWMGMTMGGTLFLAIFFGVYIRRRFGYSGALENPTYVQKVSAALWIFMARGLLPAGILGAFILWVGNYDLINGTPFGTLLKVSASYVLAVFLMQAGVKCVFTPKRGAKWRLISVTDEAAKSLSRTLLFSIICICTVSFFQTMARLTTATLEMEFAVKVVANLVKAACIILVAQRFLYKTEQSKEVDTANKEDETGEEEHISTSSKIGSLITLVMSITFILSLFGYIRLSEFILNRFILSTVFIGILFIIFQVIKVLIHKLFSLGYWTKVLRMNRKVMNKAEFWTGFLIMPVFILFGIFFLLALWGVSVDILTQSAKKFLTGFYIGGMKISLTSIFMGITAFFVTLFVFRILKNSLQDGALSKIEMDLGVRYSLIAGIGFLGVICSILIALSVMGGSLKGLAIVAGALSLGAGLGLQNVVNNFVSGIILLFERPIKIGDWVIINGQEGIVKRINIRSTTLQTWQKSDIIIPNADILSSSLTNMTHDSRMGRVDIAVGVGYGSDIDLVKETLLAIPLENKKILKTPQPFVLFTNLGESSLDFQLSCYTSDITNRGGIATDLRERIIKRFRELNIEIPFPQRDIHIINEIKSKK